MRGLGKKFRFCSILIGYTREREGGWMAADTALIGVDTLAAAISKV
jgi:hypothetical protein